MQYGNVRKIDLTEYYRVAPLVKDQIDSGKINLTAIMNTHQ